jgi:hypothetical protein
MSEERWHEGANVRTLEARIEALEQDCHRHVARIRELEKGVREIMRTPDPYGVECICRELLEGKQ